MSATDSTVVCYKSDYLIVYWACLFPDSVWRNQLPFALPTPGYPIESSSMHYPHIKK